MKISKYMLLIATASMALGQEFKPFLPPIDVRVTLNPEGLVEAVNALADDTGVVVEKIVRGIGTGSQGALPEAFRAVGRGVHEGLPEFFKEAGDGVADGMPKMRDGLQRGTDELFDPQSGYMQHVFDQFIQNGHRFQSGAFSHVIFPAAAKGVAVVGGAIITIGLIRIGLMMGSKYIEKNYFKPTVVSEYYKNTWYNRVSQSMFGKKSTPMILHASIKDRLEGLVVETQNTTKQIKSGNKQIKFSNVLLTGAPGTGKSMFAQYLARESGMSYAFVSASSFFQEGAGVGAIKDLFAWAQRAKGLILFIDEADALFVEREKLKSDSDQYKIVCEFLTHLGQKSDNFMLVMATNHPIVFDKAMQSRIDEVIEVPLPDQAMREQILDLYTESILCDASQSALFIESARTHMNAAQRAEIASACEGLSNRDLHAIVNNVAKKSLVSATGLVTQNTVKQTVADYVQKQHIFAMRS